jgi:HD-like signal output (HDOD) protein
MKPTIQMLIRDIPHSLGSYGPIIRELEAVMNNPQSNLLNVGEVIEKDSDLTVRLLRLGNSSFYGFPTRLETVAEAISLIGLVQVQDLLAASSVMEVFVGVPEEFVSMESFWRHSLACGIAARLLAIARRLPKPEKFFVAGLVHDLGRLVLFSQAPASAKEVFACYHAERQLLRQAETKVLGFDHAQIGEALLREWHYPVPLIEAVAFHHHPMMATAHPTGAAIVHLADHLANALQLGSSGERAVPPLSLKAWEHLGFASDMLESVMAAIDEQIETVQEVFLAAQPAPKRA